MESMLILGTARQQSSRIPTKMTRPFADKSLYEIYVQKLETIKSITGLPTAIAINKHDSIIWSLTKNTTLEIIERNDESVAQGISKRSEELHFLADRDECNIVWINGCFPLLNPTTVMEIIKFFQNSCEIRSLHCIKKVNNWFWDDDHNPVNNSDPSCVSTQGCPPLYESVHLLHIFSRVMLLEQDRYWPLERNDPYLYLVGDKIEYTDVDTETDFLFAEWLYQQETTDEIRKN